MVRRRLLTRALVALGALVSGSFAWLAARFVVGSSRWPVPAAKRWRAVCRLSDLASGDPYSTSFTFDRLEGWYRETVTRQIYVAKDEKGRPIAWSRRCTHLGCPVTWKGQSRTFRCACHGGVFDEHGGVLEGPPQRPLDRFACRLAGELVEVEEA